VFAKGARVLYLAPEGAHGIKKARLPAACKQRGKSTKDLRGHWRTEATAPNLMVPADIDGLIAECREAGFAPDIIVVDTLTRALGGADINTPATGAGAIIGMERLGAAFDATVIAVTHPGKDAGRGAIGSSLFESLAFAQWKVTLSGEAVFVEIEKMKDGAADFTVALKATKDDNGVPVVADVAPGEALPTRKSESLVTEGTVREALIRGKAGYGKKEGIPETRLRDLMAGPVPNDESDDHANWVVRRKQISHGLRSARSRGTWAARLSAEWAKPGASQAEWFWFQAEEGRPAAAEEPDQQVSPW
jgi:hypothetical protein